MLRRFYWWKVIGNIGFHFAGSTSLPEILALGTKLSCTNFDCGKFSPSLQKLRLLAGERGFID